MTENPSIQTLDPAQLCPPKKECRARKPPLPKQRVATTTPRIETRTNLLEITYLGLRPTQVKFFLMHSAALEKPSCRTDQTNIRALCMPLSVSEKQKVLRLNRWMQNDVLQPKGNNFTNVVKRSLQQQQQQDDTSTSSGCSRSDVSPLLDFSNVALFSEIAEETHVMFELGVKAELQVLTSLFRTDWVKLWLAQQCIGGAPPNVDEFSFLARLFGVDVEPVRGGTG